MGNLEFLDDYLFVCASNLFLLRSIGGGKKQDKPSVGE
jgi:hypothetical protein